MSTSNTHWMTAKAYNASSLNGENGEAKMNDFSSPKNAPAADTANRNALLDKITALESQQLTLISQVMAQKDELARFGPIKTTLERDLKLAQRGNELLQKELDECHAEKAEFERNHHDCDQMRAMLEKLTKERAWFEKRHLQAQEYKTETTQTIQHLTVERDHLLERVKALEAVQGQSVQSKERLIIDQLKTEIEEGKKAAEATQRELQKVQNENAEIQQELHNTLEASSEQLHQLQEWGKKYETLNNRLKEANEALNQCKTNSQSLVDEIDILKHENKILHDQVTSAPYNPNNRNMMNPGQDRPGGSAGAGARGEEDYYDVNSQQPRRMMGGPQQDRGGVSSGAPGAPYQPTNNSGQLQQQQQEPRRFFADPQQDRSGVSSGAPGAYQPGRTDSFSPTNNNGQPQQHQQSQSFDQQDRNGLSSGAPGVTYQPGRSDSFSPANNSGQQQPQSFDPHNPNSQSYGQQETSPFHANTSSNMTSGRNEGDVPQQRKMNPRSPTNAGSNAGYHGGDNNPRSPTNAAGYNGGANDQAAFGGNNAGYNDQPYATPQRRLGGPMEDRVGNSAGVGGGRGGSMDSSVGFPYVGSCDNHPAFVHKCQEFDELLRQYHILLTKQGPAAGGSNTYNITNVTNNVRPTQVDHSYFIPNNLHSMQAADLITVIMQMKETLSKLQDDNDSLSSTNFLSQHTITRLQLAAVRTSELQKYILQQESVWSVKQTNLQRDLVVAQNERDDLVRRLLGESVDQVLKGLVVRTEQELKYKDDLLKQRMAELEKQQKSYRELEIFLRSKEAEFTEQLHTLNSAWQGKLDQTHNASLEVQRQLELRSQQVFIASSAEPSQLRGETEKIWEARLAQQLLFWQEKETSWLNEKAVILNAWKKEEELWNNEKDSYEQLRLSLNQRHQELEAENVKLWQMKLVEKDELWSHKFQELMKKQVESDKIIKGMEIQWKRRVEEWKEKETILLAAVRNSTASPTNASPSQAASNSNLNVLTETEKERWLAQEGEWRAKDRAYQEQLALARLQTEAWKKEKEAMKAQIEVLARDLKADQQQSAQQQQGEASPQKAKSLGAQQEKSGQSAGAAPAPLPNLPTVPTSSRDGSQSNRHFGKSDAFQVPILTARGTNTTMSPFNEQDYQHRIQQLQALVDTLQSEVGNRSTPTNRVSNDKIALQQLQQKYEDKQREVYDLNRANQRLEEELSIRARDYLTTPHDATAQRLETIQKKYEAEISELISNHQHKIHRLQQDLADAESNATQKARKQQSDYQKSLDDLQDAQKKHLRIQEQELERMKEAHHIHLSSIQRERLEEIQRHNAQVVHYQKEKNEMNRIVETLKDEMRLLEQQLKTQEESIRILEAQLENEKEKHELALANNGGAATTGTNRPPPSPSPVASLGQSSRFPASAGAGAATPTGNSADLLAWQKEKRHLLEMQLAAEHTHADEVEKLNVKLTQCENELDREREKNKILYTQIQILSERQAKQTKRALSSTTPTSSRTVRAIDHEHQELLDELDPERKGAYGTPARDQPKSSGNSVASPTPASGSIKDLAQATATIAELESSHFAMLQSWQKEKSLLESHVNSLQNDLDQSLLEKSNLASEVTRLKHEYAILEKQASKYQKKADVLERHLHECIQARNELHASLVHLQQQYNNLSTSVQQAGTLDTKRVVELERNLQAALLDLKRVEMEKLTLHRCVATLTEKCSKMQLEKDGTSPSASSTPAGPVTGVESPSELLKLLSGQITSLTSTIEKQQLRLRLFQTHLDKNKQDALDKESQFKSMEQALVLVNAQIQSAQDRASAAEEKYQKLQYKIAGLSADDDFQHITEATDNKSPTLNGTSGSLQTPIATV